MLDIINNLKPFFEDNYRKISVREYARIMRISAPTASKHLEAYHKNNLLQKERFRAYIFYFAQRDEPVFIHLCRIYWYHRIKNAGIIRHIEEKALDPLIILYGSASKAEISSGSDVDIAVVRVDEPINLQNFRKSFGKELHVFSFKSVSEIKHPFLYSLTNGFILRGNWYELGGKKDKG